MNPRQGVAITDGIISVSHKVYTYVYRPTHNWSYSSRGIGLLYRQRRSCSSRIDEFILQLCYQLITISNGVFAGNLKHQRNTIILTIIANNILIGWLWFGSYSLFGGVLALGHFSTWVNEISVGLEQDKTRNITEGGKGPKPEISQDRSMGPKSSNTIKGQKGPNSKKTVDQNHKD